jgi:branched-chain amino acid transport system ATP-binding protein
MTGVLTLTGVTAGYGATVVLDRVSLSVQAGTTLAVLGLNGVGKTTLLATILGQTTRHNGTISFSGRSIEQLKPFRRARLGIGSVPQEREIFPSLTVEENLTVAARGARNNLVRDARWDVAGAAGQELVRGTGDGVGREVGSMPASTRAHIPTRDTSKHGTSEPDGPGTEIWTLERVYSLFPNLAERRRGMGNQLSGGEQQMLAIARALMGNPTLLLLDEPLEGLAPVIVDRVLTALRQLREESRLTMILTEQQATLALEFSDDAIILDRGRIVHAAAAEDLLADPDRLSTLIGVARAS